VTVPTTPPPTVEESADLIKGTGATLKVGDTFTAQYVLADYASHKVLQSSWSSGPFTAQLVSGQLIQGWINGMPGMRVGGRRELIIPPSLAYGSASQNGIPGNDTLVFVVDLLKIKA
jgi:peptidylprolyl isomerase